MVANRELTVARNRAINPQAAAINPINRETFERLLKAVSVFTPALKITADGAQRPLLNQPMHFSVNVGPDWFTFAANDSLAELRELPEFFEAGQLPVHRSDLEAQAHHGMLW